jgi:ribulose-bisphosphate carboxylase large chain
MTQRLTVTYRIRSDATSIEARAQTIAVEQSVEMPLAAIDEPRVLTDIVGVVEAIDDLGDGTFEARIGLAVATIGSDAGQLLNMLFGNTSLHDDVVLWDVALPPELIAGFGGPRHGIAGLRNRLRVADRGFAGSALKPQGLPVERLAKLAESLTLGGLDFVKDDHGLADQAYSRRTERLRACAAAIRRGAQATGHPTRYIPSLTGDLDTMRADARLAREEGIDCLMLAPMVSGFSTMTALVRDFPDMAFFAHPSLGGAARIAPDLLIGKLFTLIGADAVIFPNHGGRFGYSTDTCLRLAANARLPAPGLRPALPVPAGGMTIERSGEILDFYGPDTMLLIGGSLLLAREQIVPEAQRFARAVADHSPR